MHKQRNELVSAVLRFWLYFVCVAMLPLQLHADESLASTQGSDTPPRMTRTGSPIEEIVVTVSKRSESLQEVMGSVSALSGDTHTDNNIQDFRDRVYGLSLEVQL